MAGSYPSINDREFDLLKKITNNTADLADGGGGAGLPDQAGHAGEALLTDGTDPYWASVAGTGTVTSVGVVSPGGLLTVTGSPVTTAGNITLTPTNQNANRVFAGPVSGGAAAPTFRALVAADIGTAAAPPTTGSALLYGNGAGGFTNASTASTVAIQDFIQSGQFYVFEGDSLSDITWSAGQPQIGPGNNWTQKILGYQPFLNRGTGIYPAVQSSTIATMTARYAASVYPYRPGGASGPAVGTKSFLFVWIGINDIGVTNIGTMKSSWLSYMATATTDGFTVIPMTITYKNTFTSANVADMLDFNKYIRQSIYWGNRAIDTATYFPTPTDTTWYYDGVHINAAAHLWLAKAAAGQMYSRQIPTMAPTETASLISYGYVRAYYPTTSGLYPVGALDTTSNDPRVSWYNLLASSNNHSWSSGVTSSGSWFLEANNDAVTSGTRPIEIDRSTSSITNIKFNGPTTTTGIRTLTGTEIITPAPMAGTVIDVTKIFNTKTFTANDTVTFSGTPTTTNQWFGVFWFNNSGAAITINIPSSFSVSRSGLITSVVIPSNGYVYLKWFYVASITTYFVLGDAPATVGSGSFVLSTAPSITSPTLISPQISLTATPAADDTYTGTTITGLNAGATIAQWEAVYLGGSSTWLLADANGSGTYPAAGVAVAAYTSGNAATILTRGTVRNDAWAFTPGARIYLSTTAGGLTQTAPSSSGEQVQDVGFALTADVASLDFNGTYLTVA